MKSNWQIKKIESVCDIIGGGTPSKSNISFYEGNIPWATVRDMKNENISETEFKITKEAIKQSATNIIPSNNVVIATRVGLGKICLLKNDTAINQDLKGIIPKNNNELSVSFLFWWLKNIADIIIKNGSGATVQGVKLQFIRNLEIPIPPLSEQQRIVAKLDELSSQIQELEATYKQKLADLEELKKSVLNKAFSGEL